MKEGDRYSTEKGIVISDVLKVPAAGIIGREQRRNKKCEEKDLP